MKKLIALLLSLLLLSAPALAEDLPEKDESAELTYEELEMYLSALSQAALTSDSLTIQREENDVWALFDGGAIMIADEDLTPSTAVVGAALIPGQEDPRGLTLGCTLAQVLSAYPCDNPELFGTYYDAALYIRGEKPEVSVGYVLRDGQRVTQVVHTLEHWTQDGVIECGIVYDLDQGTVAAISILGMQDVIGEDEALQTVKEIGDMQENREYFAYPQSESGADVPPFQREDLSFAGMDFLDLTAEGAIAAFGNPNVDEWTEDSTGEFLRLLQWDGLTVQLVYDAQKTFLHVDALTVSDPDLEGPRGVRSGDLMDTVIDRFRHDENQTVEGGMLLYGDGETAPFGLLSYSTDTASLTYTLDVGDGRTVLWYLVFDGAELTEYRMLLR